MNENNEKNTTQSGATEPAAKAPEQNTQPQAVNVDIESIVRQAEQKAAEVAERRAEGAFKNMLQQQGLDADAINKMTEQWKAQQRTPEAIANEFKEENTKLMAKLEQSERNNALLAKGVPAEKAAQYSKLAESYVNDKTDFPAAIELALADFPIAKSAPPAYAAGTGTKPVNNNVVKYEKEIEQAYANRDMAAVAYYTRLQQQGEK